MTAHQHRISKRQKRVLKQQGVLEDGNQLSTSFGISTEIKPMTDNQAKAFMSWNDGYNIMLHGIAGTGKTFMALYFAFKDVFDKKSEYEKVWLIRSTVSSRDQGFMPGTRGQKEAVYEEPYPPICEKLFGRADSYSILKQKNMVEFRSTSFLRGVTFDNCIIVVDEIQNMTFQECDTTMTRVGQNCRIIFAGDIKQDDLTNKRYNEQSGLRDFMEIIKIIDEFKFVEFFINDILRSDLVKQYIIAKDKLSM
jgi:phosphate starvation-inducible protein PhoH